MRYLSFAIALFFTVMAHAQTSKPVYAKLQKVTVYLQGAHLYYTETVNLSAGNNDIVFENISPNIVETSMQASSKGGVVMDVMHEVKYKEKKIVPHRYDKEINAVLDSIDDMNYEIKDLDNKLKVLATEKNMLLGNRMIKGEYQKDSLALLQGSMAFLKEKLNGIYEQELKLDRAKSKADKKRAKLNERYNSLILLQNGQMTEEGEDAEPIHQVIVTLFAENATTATVTFNYFINDASWVPAYDLQATSATSALQLKYFANVTQNSGLNWKNASLTLSTSSPNESNVKPELSPWYLSFLEYKKQPTAVIQSNAYIPTDAITYNWDFAGNKAGADMQKTIVDYVTMTENLIRTEYEIKLNYTIDSDGKPHKVMINDRSVPMKLEFATVPKVCTDAFLLARITGWEDMNIIPGNARLYFDGGYVGEMYLDASTTYDTLSVNLGRDKTIAITRKKIKEKMKEKFIGDEKVETRSIELVVRNTKNIPIEISVDDQIPVVQGTEEIKVKLVDGDGAELDEPSGRLTWKLKLGSKESKKFIFTYEIRYPKSKPIAGL